MTKERIKQALIDEIHQDCDWLSDLVASGEIKDIRNGVDHISALVGALELLDPHEAEDPEPEKDRKHITDRKSWIRILREVQQICKGQGDDCDSCPLYGPCGIDLVGAPEDWELPER